MPAGPTDLSHLDIETLKKFATDDVGAFITLLKALGQEGNAGSVGGAPSMGALKGQLDNPAILYTETTLVVGLLGNKEGKNGNISVDPLMTYTKAAATALEAIEVKQQSIFQHISDNFLKSLIPRMEAAKQKSLEDIKSQSFLNDFRNLDVDLAPAAPSPPPPAA
ncbi:type VII secretion system-associated protein [Streptomyces sp. NPDC054863]